MDLFLNYLSKRNNVKNVVLDSIYWLSFMKNVETSIPSFIMHILFLYLDFMTLTLCSVTIISIVV